MRARQIVELALAMAVVEAVLMAMGVVVGFGVVDCSGGGYHSSRAKREKRDVRFGGKGRCESGKGGRRERRKSTDPVWCGARG